MKAILMSIQPQWVAKILNGEKTIEVRKHFPKDFRGWVYIYCTKGKTELYSTNKGYVLTDFGLGEYYKTRYLLNGKVVARFWCDNVEGINWGYGCYYSYSYVEEDILKKSCLSFDDLAIYLKGKIGYAIHISQLEIFDKPKELSEFYPPKYKYCDVIGEDYRYSCRKCPYATDIDCNYVPLTRAPQSWQYIEVNE